MRKLLFFTASILQSLFLMNCDNSNQQKNNTVAKEISEDSSCTKENIESSTKASTESQITCPKCGYKKIKIMPTDVCLIKYTCDSCTAVSFSKDGDCCVFCSYGTHKCPSKQND